MNAPVTCREGLELAISIVRGSPMINEIKSWKVKHLMYIPQDNASDNSDDENNNDADDGDDGDDVIGKAWWRGFCWHHRNQLSI